MTRNEQLADVIRLACLTGDRTDAEQRALIAWAWDCDREHNRNTTTNRAKKSPAWEPQDLVGLVMATRELEDGQRPVAEPKNRSHQWEVWGDEWSTADA